MYNNFSDNLNSLSFVTDKKKAHSCTSCVREYVAVEFQGTDCP